jgi:hypothetical protein
MKPTLVPVDNEGDELPPPEGVSDPYLALCLGNVEVEAALALLYDGSIRG